MMGGSIVERRSTSDPPSPHQDASHWVSGFHLNKGRFAVRTSVGAGRLAHSTVGHPFNGA